MADMTITVTPTRRHSPAASFALASMVSVQLGAAASIHMFGAMGPAGTAWLRVTWAALAFLVIARPRVWTMRPRQLLGPAVLGAVSAGMTLLFSEAISRIPLATSVAVEFLGPLAVGMLKPGARRWPPLAFAGVLLVTEPWQGSVNLPGLGFALGGAACWAGYILLTQRVADGFDGLVGLSLAMPVAAVVSAFAGLPQALPHLTPLLALEGLGLALLMPVLPYALEMVALRRLTTSAFGTLMSLEPAIALVVGVAVLHQSAGPMQLLGVLTVTVAAVGAARSGRREEPPGDE